MRDADDAATPSDDGARDKPSRKRSKFAESVDDDDNDADVGSLADGLTVELADESAPATTTTTTTTTTTAHLGGKVVDKHDDGARIVDPVNFLGAVAVEKVKQLLRRQAVGAERVHGAGAQLRAAVRLDDWSRAPPPPD